MTYPYILRQATLADTEALQALHRAALRALAGAHYTPRQIEGFLADFQTVDPVLIEDGTYLVAEQAGRIVASGGWTRRPPCFARLVGPLAQAIGPTATMRAIFTAPDHARRGLARRIMAVAEEQAVLHGGAERLVLCATLTGLPLCLRLGYVPVDATTVALSNGESFAWINMTKTVWDTASARSHPGSCHARAA